ncbi:dTDP-4-dehydrorhamnose reductase [Prochlorococcus sp. MIT 1300]|uniref:dTDP-4-dehydrorhamnose reductase n=1 Tax=Prochlorococcus sp. MIT 1300 TaxID=3096218 RepID=UPI002A759891|nr:dTDP-4-dehydrorhamnose reductase [Prochlorococcus sp. MIT 1300]
MKVLLTGASGQLGHALQASTPDNVHLISCRHHQLDLTDENKTYRLVSEIRPDWVINAAAFTAVDQAENKSDLCYAINAQAPATLVKVVDEINGRLLQISTDFIFNGEQGNPYSLHQDAKPLGVYGASKAAGEEAVLEFPGSKVLRTSWLYGPVGSNFCLTMLRLHATRAARGQYLDVVADQIGSPTSTYSLAGACWGVLAMGNSADPNRIFHWSDSGVASWFDFAVAIGELSVSIGLLDEAAIVRPITTEEYPTPAKRPKYSVLDCSSTRKLLHLYPLHWRSSLEKVLVDISRGVS